MKTRSSLFLIVIPLLMVSNGCLEYHTTTRVRTDGSLSRDVIVKGDSSGVFGWNFLIAVDSSWDHTIRKTDDRKWQLEAHREFESPAEWAAYQNSTRVRVLRFHISFEKSFSWFRTQYVYTERLESFNTFRRLPVTDFLSPAELEAFFL